MAVKVIRKFRLLYDVTFGTPNDGDVATYDQATDKVIMAAPTGGGGGGDAVEFDVTQTTHGLAVGDVVRLNGTNYVKAQANSAANAEVVGIVSAVANANNFTLTTAGHVTGLTGLTAGTVYYLDDVTAGAVTVTEPAISKPVLIAATATAGWFFNMRGLSGGSSDSSFPDRVFITGAGFDEIDAGAEPWFTTPAAGIGPFGTRYNKLDGDWITWAFSLRAGTYRLTLVSYTWSGGGKLTFSLNTFGSTFIDITGAPYNATNDTADTYDVVGGGALNAQIEVCDDLTIPADGDYSLRVRANGKNPSSSGWVSNINAIILERVGP